MQVERMKFAIEAVLVFFDKIGKRGGENTLLTRLQHAALKSLEMIAEEEKRHLRLLRSVHASVLSKAHEHRNRK